MLVKDIMKKDVVVVEKSMLAADAIQLMLDKGVGSLLIKEGSEYGIVTRKDIVNKVVALHKDLKAARIGDILTQPILTIPSDMSVREVARLMAKASIRRFPVVDNNELVGIVSNSDVLRSFA